MDVLVLVAIVTLGLAGIALRLAVIRRQRERGPEWWSSFEREFWDFVERGELPRPGRHQGHMG